MNNPNDYLVGLDIGSHKVLCVVALPSPKGEGLYRICGYSFRDSHGVRNGIVTDLNAAVDDIKAAVREARSAGNLPELSNAWVAIGGSSLTSENCLGTAVVRGNEVKPADVEAAENNAREHSLQRAVLAVKGKFGKNALVKGMSLNEKATALERNKLIGGHRAGFDDKKSKAGRTVKAARAADGGDASVGRGAAGGMRASGDGRTADGADAACGSAASADDGGGERHVGLSAD